MTSDLRARLVTPSTGGKPGEGVWSIAVGDYEVTAIVQPSKDIPGESWISRAWDPRLGRFLGGGGQDALDAALAVVEDWCWTRVSISPRVAVTGDSREQRPHRAGRDLFPVDRRPMIAATDPEDAFGVDEEEDAFG